MLTNSQTPPQRVNLYIKLSAKVGDLLPQLPIQVDGTEATSAFSTSREIDTNITSTEFYNNILLLLCTHTHLCIHIYINISV